MSDEQLRIRIDTKNEGGVLSITASLGDASIELRTTPEAEPQADVLIATLAECIDAAITSINELAEQSE